MSEEQSLEECKAEVLIKLRKYKLVKKEKHKDSVSYIVKIPKEKLKARIWCIPEERTVGIAFIKRLEKAMKEANMERAIIITSGRYTHAAKKNAKNFREKALEEAKKRGVSYADIRSEIELLPRIFPAFNIFEHELVPKHEMITPKEREQVLAQYRVQPYQLPQIKASDPAVKIIGAKPGDILRVIRKSSTAGEYIAYRYVVE